MSAEQGPKAAGTHEVYEHRDDQRLSAAGERQEDRFGRVVRDAGEAAVAVLAFHDGVLAACDAVA